MGSWTFIDLKILPFGLLREVLLLGIFRGGQCRVNVSVKIFNENILIQLNEREEVSRYLMPFKSR